MSIDLFTFIAQIVNFSILFLLLRRFLFKPIIAAMDKREKLIAERLDRADRIERSAAEKKAEAEASIRQFNEEKQALWTAAVKESDAVRLRLESSARDQVASLRKDWIEGFTRERSLIAADLRTHSGRIILSILRRMFHDLADDEMERGIVHTFINRLSMIDRSGLPESNRSDSNAWQIVSSFPVPESSQEEIRKLIRERMDPGKRIEFSVNRESLCGIELRFGERRLAWHLDDYLGQLNDVLQEFGSSSARMRRPV
jgi:F-type H+-transporting ATPase subunit b